LDGVVFPDLTMSIAARFPELMTLRALAVVPPMVLALPKIRIPTALAPEVGLAGKPTVPVALVSMKFPRTTLLLDSSKISTPPLKAADR